MNITQLPVTSIRAGDNDRKEFDGQKLKELSASIRDNGLAQPITVRPQGDLFQIVCGERRFRAVKTILGWEEISCIIRELDDEQASAIMLAENVQRVDLNPMDEAVGYKKRMEAFGWSVKITAVKASVSDTRVRSRLRLLSLVPEAQHLLKHNNLPIGFGEELSPLDVNRQRIALRWLNSQARRPSRRVFARYVGELLEQQQQATMFDLSLFAIPQIEEAVSSDKRLVDILPLIKKLPDLPERNLQLGEVTDRYIAELLRSGHKREAMVIIDFWMKMQGINALRLSPYNSQVLKEFGAMFLEC